MRQYTWDEYYEKFYDWAESTQVRNLSGLTSLGPASEVGEIIIELQVNVPAANRLLKRAVEAKMAFSASDLVEFLCLNDKTLATAALHNSASGLTAADMENLYGIAEDEDIIAVCNKYNLLLPEDLREEEYEEEYEEEEEYIEEEIVEEEPCEEKELFIDEEPPARPRGPGFFSMLFAIIGAADALGNSGHRMHSGRCDGDCANCPPHYGYRYGRWYYGRHHVHGCEFGGNSGSGGL